MEDMLISPTNSGHNSDQEFFEQGSDEAFEIAFLKTFKKENDKLMSDESEENESNLNFQEKSFEEDTKNKNNENPEEEPNDIKNSNSDNRIIETQEELFVEIKKPQIFKVYKGEDLILFNHPINTEYYEKYKSDLIFIAWKNQKTRKEMPDEIRKKIKSRFFKDLKKCINQKLDFNEIKTKFDYLPQNFISNISKSENKSMLNKTLEELIINFEKENGQEKSGNNLVLLRNLQRQYKENIYKTQRIYNIFKVNIKELFNEYLKSDEFHKSIVRLKEEGNYSEYIKDYINKAEDFVNYFSN